MPVTFTADEQWASRLAPEIAEEVQEATLQDSLVLSKFRRLRNMTGRETWIDVRAELPTASAVDGYDEGDTPPSPRDYMKQGTTQRLEPRIIRAGEFAAWKVFREADLNDMMASGYDPIAADIPIFASQFGAAIDKAVFWGKGKPVEWSDTDSLWKRADDNGLVVTPGTGAGDSAYTDVFGEGGLMQLIELTGYDPNGIVSALQMRAKLQGMKDQDGRPIFAQNATMQEGTPFVLGGFPLNFARNGMWDYSKASMMMADFERLVYSIREEMTYRITRDGSLTDANGVTHNLAQQNKVAIILHMRLGWQILDPVSQMSETPVPFAFLGVNP